METSMNRFSWNRVERWLKSAEGRRFLTCMLAVLAWGLITHAYAFLNPTFSHDSMRIYADAVEENWKLALGRFLAPVYRIFFRGPLAAPWLIGVLSMLWIGLACYGVVRLFDFKSKPVIVLIAGVMSANLTTIAQAATFIYEMDFDMLALLLSVLAAYIWRRKTNAAFLLGAIPAAASLALYQSYISVTIVLIMMLCMMDLLEGVSAGRVVLRGLQAIAMLAAAAVLYYVLMKASLALSGQSLVQGNYNSLTNAVDMSRGSVPERLRNAYLKSGITYMLGDVYTLLPVGMMKGVNAVFFICLALGILGGLLKSKAKLGAKLLFVLLGVLLPFGANVSGFLNNKTHTLMRYAAWMLYLLAPLMLRFWLRGSAGKRACFRRWTFRLSAAMMAVILFSNVGFANGAYLKKDLERSITMSTLTRVTERMHACEGYVAGETPVKVVGLRRGVEKPGFEPISRLIGCETLMQVTGNDSLKLYYRYFLDEPINISERKLNSAGEQQIKDMPAFPAQGSVAFVEDVLVVKLG